MQQAVGVITLDGAPARRGQRGVRPKWGAESCSLAVRHTTLVGVIVRGSQWDLFCQAAGGSLVSLRSA